MKQESKSIDSPQQGIHENLEKIVLKHLHHPYQKPIQAHNTACFERIRKAINSHNSRSLILDSCCGTGMSAYSLAQKNPDHCVIAIDQSEVRLSKEHNHKLNDHRGNVHFFRANCEDIWRLCVDNNIRFEQHSIFYPNPYPKSTQLKRRWHAHPVFPYLPKLADKTLLRSNWRIYLEEFAFAWKLATGDHFSVHALKVKTPLTLFEKKYTESNQVVYELQITHR